MIYSILKNIFFVSSFLFYLTAFSLSEINYKEWSVKCSKEKTSCLAVITSGIKDKDNKMQTIATAYIKIGSSKQKKMNLINEDNQTYKLSEENKIVPVLFVKLPLNVDLAKKPVIVIDKKRLGDLNFTHCNSDDGCVTNVAINNNVVELFKKGKTMSVVIGKYGTTNNLQIDFPLKNFSKSYAQLIKK